MIEFKIGRTEYKIDKIKIKHYYEIQDLQFLDGIEAQMKFIASIAECPVDDLRKLTKSEFTTLWAAVYERFLQKKKDQPLMKTLHLNGVDYGIVHLDELTVGEFADLDIIQNDPLREKKLHQMMAILYRPMKGWTKGATYYQVEPYDSTECNRRSEDFLELDLDIVMGSMNFFLTIAEYCLNRTVDSLEKLTSTDQEKIMIEDLRWTISQLLEDGFSSSHSSQMKILSSLQVLQKSVSEQVSTMQPISKTKTSGLKSKLTEKLQGFATRLVAKKSGIKITNTL